MLNELSPSEKQRVMVAVEVLGNLAVHAQKVCQQRELLLSRLTDVSSKADLYEVTTVIANNESDANRLYQQVVKDLQPALIQHLLVQIQSKAVLENIYKTILFRDFSKQILERREYIDTQELRAKFIGLQAEEVALFLNALEELEPMRDVLSSQEKIFQERLNSCTSEQDLESIESDIMRHTNLARGIYDSKMNQQFSDPVVDAINEYIGNNIRVLTLLAAWNLTESLANSIMGVRMAQSRVAGGVGRRF